MIYNEISLEELIEKMSDNEHVIIVKDKYPDSLQDVRLCVEEYIGDHCYLDESDKDKDKDKEKERFIDPDAIEVEDGPDDFVFIVVPKDMDAERIAIDLEREYLGKLSCEVTNKAALKRAAMTSSIPLEPDEYQPS